MSTQTRTAEIEAESEPGFRDGYTLPADYYIDPSIRALESEHVLGPSWQYVGNLGAVAEPGSYFTCDLDRMPVVVVRDSEGEIRAFANVCRHRGMVIAEGTGKCGLLQCPYHGWTYRLTGQVQRAPGFDRNPEFDAGSHALKELRIEGWGPLAFVARDPRVVPLSEYLHPLPELLAEVDLDLDGLRFFRRYEYAIEANWKVAIENSLECYHCAVAHPELKAITDLKNFVVTNHEYISSQTAPTRPGDEKANYAATTGEIARGVWTHIWPNSEISVNPGPSNLSARFFLPLGHRRVLAVYDQYLAEGATSEDQQVGSFADLVAKQDIALCEGVQKGLESGAFERGPLNLGRLPNEIGLQWWEQRYIKAMP